MDYLSLKVPGADGTSVEIIAPSNIPTTGLSGDGGEAIGFGLTLLLIIVIFLSLGFIVYGGFTFITSGGDKSKIEGARKTIIYAILGLIISFMSFFLLLFIGRLLGVENFLRITL